MYCTNCSKQTDASASFCTACGAPIAPDEQRTSAAGQQPIRLAAKAARQEPANSRGKASQRQRRGFVESLISGFRELLKQPKKLLPTLILAAIWLIMPLITGFIKGANIPIVRFFCTLTYANGGIFGGFFGLLGGIFGKAVFAAVVNGLVLMLLAKKNPFAGIGKGIGGVFGGGMKAISPLLLGSGLGLVLYCFFNITSAPQNSAVAVVAAIAAVQSLAKQNGLIFGGVFFLSKKLSGGKAPTRVTVSRILTGLSSGFAMGFALTFLRYPIVIFALGIILLAAGIGIRFIGRNTVKKAAATAAILLMLGSMFLPFAAMPAYAASNVPSGYSDPYDIKNMDVTWVSFRPQLDGYWLEPVKMQSKLLTWEVLYVIKSMVGINIDELDTVSFNDDILIVNRGQKNNDYVLEGALQFSLPGKAGSQRADYTYSLDYKYNVKLSNIRFVDKDNRFIADYSGYETVDFTTNDPELKAVSRTRELSKTSPQNYALLEQEDGEIYVKLWDPDYQSKEGMIMTFRMCGYLPKGKAPASAFTDSVNSANSVNETVVLYRGRLTYTNGKENKYGQPFPDLMDFDRDGDIDYTDRQIQYDLVHNPDYLDTPQGAALVGAALVSALLAGSVSIAVSGGSGMLGTLLSSMKFDFSASETDADDTGQTGETAEEKEYEEFVKHYDSYIETDDAGDIYVADPVSGEKQFYILEEDGSYRHRGSGQGYTKDEIRSELAYKERNAGYFSDIESKRVEAVEAQHEQNQELSQAGKECKSEETREREAYLNSLAEKYGVNTNDEKALKRAIKQAELEEHSRQSEIWTAEGDTMEAYETGAEYIKKGADIAADVVATADKTGIFKDVYSATTAAAGNAGEVMAGNMDIGDAIVKTSVDASTEIIKNRVDKTGAKFTANILGNAAQNAAGAILKGEDIGEVATASFEGAAKGFAEATVDYAAQTGNSMAGGTYLSKAGETLAADVVKAALPDIELPTEED